MVQDRRIVSIKVEHDVVYALSNGYVADDLGWRLTPKPPIFLHFLSPFISSYRVNVEVLNLVHMLVIHSIIHSLLVKLTYRSRTQDSLVYTIQTSRNSITVFIQCSCNEVFITQMTSLSWQLSVVRASSQIVVLRCCRL